MIEFRTLYYVVCGIIMGTVSRLITMKTDDRQTPSIPNGAFINVVMGFIAATLGAVAIPTLLSKDFTAVTFLTLAVEQFREFRDLQRKSLHNLEHTEYVKRGEAYIDGIAKTYESRFYLAMLTAFATVFVLEVVDIPPYWLNAVVALVVGLVVTYALQWYTRGKLIGDICTIKQGSIRVEQSTLYVDDMFVSNELGIEKYKKMFLEQGMAFVITANSEKLQLTLDNLGQRQAILFEAARAYGVKKYAIMYRNLDYDKLIIAFIPIVHDPEGVMEIMRNTPVLENSRKVSSILSAGRK